MHARNTSALFYTNAYTVQVIFGAAIPHCQTPVEAHSRHYYLTNLPSIRSGDTVVVYDRNILTLACVADVIPGTACTESPDEVGWVVAKVDLDYHATLMARNVRLRELAAPTYQKLMKQSFAERLMSELDAPSLDKLKEVLNPTN